MVPKDKDLPLNFPVFRNWNRHDLVIPSFPRTLFLDSRHPFGFLGFQSPSRLLVRLVVPLYTPIHAPRFGPGFIS